MEITEELLASLIAIHDESFFREIPKDTVIDTLKVPEDHIEKLFEMDALMTVNDGIAISKTGDDIIYRNSLKKMS